MSSCTQLLTKQALVAAESNVPSNEIRFESPTALRSKITVLRDLMPCTFVVRCVPNCLSAFLLQSTGRQSVCVWGGGSSKILSRSISAYQSTSVTTQKHNPKINLRVVLLLLLYLLRCCVISMLYISTLYISMFCTGILCIRLCIGTLCMSMSLISTL